MYPRYFFKYLAIVTASSAAFLGVLHVTAPQAQMHWKLAIATVLLFVLVCIGLFYAGSSAAKSSNKYAFTNLVSLSVFGKMVLTLAFLYVYQQVTHPENQWFVGIFLFCYVVYTSFEVWFMTKLAKER